MSDATDSQPISDACPFIDADDAGCSSQLNLGHLSQAFDLCMGRYRSCASFYRLSSQQPQRMGLTVHGRSLQPTGS